VAYRRIKGGEAGREIWGDNHESLNKSARLGGGGLLIIGSTTYLEEIRAVIYHRSGGGNRIALSSSR
jgi:hypothetical protein